MTATVTGPAKCRGLRTRVPGLGAEWLEGLRMVGVLRAQQLDRYRPLQEHVSPAPHSPDTVAGVTFGYIAEDGLYQLMVIRPFPSAVVPRSTDGAISLGRQRDEPAPPPPGMD
jgi:hypothetical protein